MRSSGDVAPASATGVIGVVALCTWWGGLGAAVPGGLVGLTATLGACASCATTGQHQEAACFTGCCCLCHDCTRLSNAWHLRNVFVAVGVLAVPAAFASGLMGLILLRAEPHCSSTCMTDQLDKCSSCPGAVVLLHTGSLARCCAKSDYESSTCRGYRRITCTTDDDVKLQLWDGCQGACDCLGGTMSEPACDDYGREGNAALMNCVSVVLLWAVSIWTSQVFSKSIRRHGAWGCASSTHSFQPGVVGGSVNRDGMVIGQPVLGDPTIVVAATALPRATPTLEHGRATDEE